MEIIVQNALERQNELKRNSGTYITVDFFFFSLHTIYCIHCKNIIVKITNLLVSTVAKNSI